MAGGKTRARARGIGPRGERRLQPSGAQGGGARRGSGIAGGAENLVQKRHREPLPVPPVAPVGSDLRPLAGRRVFAIDAQNRPRLGYGKPRAIARTCRADFQRTAIHGGGSGKPWVGFRHAERRAAAAIHGLLGAGQPDRGSGSRAQRPEGVAQRPGRKRNLLLLGSRPAFGRNASGAQLRCRGGNARFAPGKNALSIRRAAWASARDARQGNGCACFLQAIVAKAGGEVRRARAGRAACRMGLGYPAFAGRAGGGMVARGFCLCPGVAGIASGLQ